MRIGVPEVDEAAGSGPGKRSCASQAPPASLVLASNGYDHAVRWRPGERLEQVFEHQCDWMRQHGRGDHLAVDADGVALTYGQLDARANQLARYLLAQGAKAGDRIGLLFDDAVHSYVGMLAVLKINAAYVPLDIGFPQDRLAYIVKDAGARIVLSLSHVRDRLADVAAELICVDEVTALVAAEDDSRLTDAEKGSAVDELCYIIYTSGTTGRPKGVAIEHASICNFVRVAAEVYGMQSRDRVYQGMTIAFDFSVEEIWVPFAAGATLVPKPGGSSLLGLELREFLQARRVTALCCVPTLLATLDEDVPDLRFLLVSGEACPQYLIARWHRPGRRFLNVYGPTEATVTATWALVDPDKPVTLGVPLPTYSVVILDPVEAKALAAGETGEIGIAGVGLATGYVNRDDLTDRAFVPDFLGIADNPSGRIYRTGDLGRVNDDGHIEYHGRIDTQVKIRGYRIELAEIESVLLQIPGIAQAVVDTFEPEPGVVELVAYYSLRKDTATVDPDDVLRKLRKRLPGYMVPAYFEELEVIPMLPSDKADRKNLPAPKGPRSLATQGNYVAPTTATETVLAAALAGILGLERVSVDSHFFDDLGANSLFMARFCARVREHADLPSVSMREVYTHTTIRELAAALGDALPASAEPPAPPDPLTRHSTRQYVTCGALQLLVFLGYTYLSAVVVVYSLNWLDGAAGFAETYVRSVEVACASFVYFCTAPIVLKWILVGRWKQREIPIWSFAYVRFWTVKTLIRANPLALFVGSPLYVLYLRALGAKIGPGVLILSRNMPVCTDLLTIGGGSVIRKDSFFSCYQAQAGMIQTGTVKLGTDVFVGEKTVLDIETSMGDGAQLGHASGLLRHQAIPDGEHWHGSPARATDTEYWTVGQLPRGAWRRFSYSVFQLLIPLLIYVPVGFGVTGGLLEHFSGSPLLNVTGGGSIVELIVASLVLYFGIVLTGLVTVATVPRLLNLALTPGRVYPLYTMRYAIARTITRMTNVKFYVDLFGDSAYIPYYLRYLGYKSGRLQQTGSNYGTELGHESPYLTSVGTGTMVSDALSIMNAEYSRTAFRMSSVTIGAQTFLGNNIAYPAGARVGDNCLLGTKVMVPLDGNIRKDVGLLGSPCFEIPRSVQSDSRFDHLRTGQELSRRLAAKRRYNTATIALFLIIRWVRFAVAFLITTAAAGQFGVPTVAAASVIILLFGVAYGVLIERLVTRFRPLSPQFCSIYQPYFWWHERVWKLLASPLFNGTPFKNVMWRLLGVRIGRRVFDDGCGIPEKTLVTIGDDCTLNAGSIIQCHSLEDGTFKSDRTVIGAGCTLGVESFIHYGATMGAGSVLTSDAFLMKGEEVPPHTRWQGNPASEVRGVLPGAPAPGSMASASTTAAAATT
jgi:non-ribosomal peptide synthetase-like protein